MGRGGFLFYRDPLALKEDDARTLGVILSSPDAFRPFRGQKKCGGFHPDYAIVGSANGEEITYLICSGCGEAKVYRPDRSEARYDLGYGTKSPGLSAILEPYRKNRPMPIEGPEYRTEANDSDVAWGRTRPRRPASGIMNLGRRRPLPRAGS